MFCGPAGLSVPHTIAPSNPEIGSAAERGWASKSEAKLWMKRVPSDQRRLLGSGCFKREDAAAVSRSRLGGRDRR
jgi:hypothetical protein